MVQDNEQNRKWKEENNGLGHRFFISPMPRSTFILRVISDLFTVFSGVYLILTQDASILIKVILGLWSCGGLFYLWENCSLMYGKKNLEVYREGIVVNGKTIPYQNLKSVTAASDGIKIDTEMESFVVSIYHPYTLLKKIESLTRAHENRRCRFDLKAAQGNPRDLSWLNIAFCIALLVYTHFYGFENPLWVLLDSI